MNRTYPLAWTQKTLSFACLLSFALSLLSCDTTSEVTHPDIITNSIGVEFTKIKAGTFRMGSDRPEEPKPEHEVTISQDFYLGTFEVTQAQWVAVMGENPSRFTTCGGDCPVEMVSWDDVQRFIQALNEREGTTAYRLPTEAEWEFATRAGTTTNYWFGDDAAQLASFAWYRTNADMTTHPVGEKPANLWGLHDMHGNVYEWVADWFDHRYYEVSPSVDPAGPAEAPQAEQPFPRRVIRGGSWLHDDISARSPRRNQRTPESQLVYVGFRLAKTIE